MLVLADRTHSGGHFLALVAANGLFGNVVGLFLPIYFQRIGLTGLQSGIYLGLAKYGHQWPLILSGVILTLSPVLLRLKDAGFEGEYEGV